MSVLIPNGYRLLAIGEKALWTDSWIDRCAGSVDLEDWRRDKFNENLIINHSHSPHIRKVENESKESVALPVAPPPHTPPPSPVPPGPSPKAKSESIRCPRFPIPNGWERLQLGERIGPDALTIDTSFRSLAKSVTNWSRSYLQGSHIDIDNMPYIKPVKQVAVPVPVVPEVRADEMHLQRDVRVPAGWRLLAVGEEIEPYDRYCREFEGSLVLDDWSDCGLKEHGLKVESAFLPRIRKQIKLRPCLESPLEDEEDSDSFEDGEGLEGDRNGGEMDTYGGYYDGPDDEEDEDDLCDIEVPDGWRLLEVGEISRDGDLYCEFEGGSPELCDWLDDFEAGDAWDPHDFLPTIRKKDEVQKNYTMSAIIIPKGYRLLSYGERRVPGTLVCPKPSGSFLLKDWVEGADGSFRVASDPPMICPIVLPGLATNPAPVGQTEKKERVPMANVASGFFNSLKASAVQNARCAASTTLAEKITDLVVSRLPGRLQGLSCLVPRSFLVFAVSSAVYAAALKFDLPARDRVRDISKYATDGSMYEAMRWATTLLEPLFQAIKDMVPSDVSQLINDAGR